MTMSGGAEGRCDDRGDKKPLGRKGTAYTVLFTWGEMFRHARKNTRRTHALKTHSLTRIGGTRSGEGTSHGS